MLFDNDESEELDEFEKSLNRMFSRKALNATKARIRNTLKRESQASEKRNSEMASYLLNQLTAERVLNDTEYRRKAREQHAVVVSISRLTASVLHSIDVKAPIVIEKSSGQQLANAKTDFTKIVIGVKSGIYNEHDRGSIASLVHLTKGLVYHEGGHIKFTTPFNVLVDMSGMDLPFGSRHELMRAWNVLEDQRMETAMCSLSPVLAKYFTSIVINVVINKNDVSSNWPWLAGRTYLPSSIREFFREAANTHTQSHLITEINECVMRYRKSTDAKEMVSCVVQFAGLLTKWGVGAKDSDEHDFFSRYERSEIPNPGDIPPVDEQENESNDQHGEEVVEKDDSTTGEEEQETGTKPADGETHRGAPGDKPDEPQDIDEVRSQEKERLRNAAKELLDDELGKGSKAEDHEIDDFISSVNTIKNDVIMPDRTISPMTNGEIEKSKEVASSMLSVLERLFVQVEPTWSLYQEDGILDPTTYMTREPGDINFWSGIDGSGNSGHDVAVSVLLDSSGSMQSNMDKVSIAAMGIRHACDHLGIPCTITTFNDDVYMVAPANEDVGFVRVSSDGGTSVFNAMMAIDDQKYGKTYHLVIVLTDGEWFDVSDVRIWSHPQRHIAIAGFGYGLERYISDKYADQWVVINDPLELPNLVTDALVKQFV